MKIHDAMEGARAAQEMLSRLGWPYDAMSFCRSSSAIQVEEAMRVQHQNADQEAAFWVHLGATLCDSPAFEKLVKKIREA